MSLEDPNSKFDFAAWGFRPRLRYQVARVLRLAPQKPSTVRPERDTRPGAKRP